ncbi:MAG TPA: hypothetical protein VLI41_06185 [Phenylobacterium sp.]|uniref:hypothetical protein n=1 Tax=Phenylobacterium sp. TaxID=1871053 RepID=UPI002C702B01|nr:hypothetical protein [Phenylobacterium sp.]HSV02777.1 hypothetical protein [Phenylobacterium sp.]
MKSALLAASAIAALSLAACVKQHSPEHSEVATAMPDAASTPGAQGPAAQAPHAPPPDTTTLSDTHPTPAGPAANSLPPPPQPGQPAQGSPASQPSK